MSVTHHSWLAIFKKHLPALVWAGLIFWLSAQSTLPSATLTWLDFAIKHGAHIFVYAVLYFLLWRAQKPRHFLPLIITFLYALSDEYHQSFVPSRQMTLIDIGFDTLGALSAFLLTYRSKPIHSLTQQNHSKNTK